ncbi:MAG: hypothetical protein LBJ47_12145 [Tannerella sp.]|jgi:hypothetical protein|nr:hypothetical protein [Tannerella sp.]
MKRAVCIRNQWLGDVAVRESGDISSIVEIAACNNISVTERLTAGDEILIPAQANSRIADYFRINNIYPATAMEQEPGTPGGIGYMAVGITFTVSG